MDIVFVKGDEKKFFSIARRIGNETVFVYELDSSKDAILVNTKTMNKKANLVFIKGETEVGRNVDIVFSLEDSSRKDFIHHRNSGMNHIIAKEFAAKDIIVGFSFALYLRRGGDVLGRMRQNVKLCRKYGVPMVFGSFASSPYEIRSSHDLESFAKEIGMIGAEIRASRTVLIERMERNKKRDSGRLPAPGVEVLD